MLINIIWHWHLFKKEQKKKLEMKNVFKYQYGQVYYFSSVAYIIQIN